MDSTNRPPAGQRLAEWVDRYADRLRGYIWSTIRDASLAEDLVQEVFLRAWRAHEYYVDEGKERAYLFRIADRLVRDHWRTTRQHASPIEWINDDLPATAIEEPEPIDRIIAQENEASLRAALDTLTDNQRRTLLMRYWSQMSFEEVAQVLGCPLGTALSHAHRGLEQLRRILSKETV